MHSCTVSKTTTLFVSRVVAIAGLLMQTSHTRLVCRAHNCYTPSIALWQHFVLCSPPIPRRRRLLSTATEAAQTGAGADSNSAHVEETLTGPGKANGLQEAKNDGGKVVVEPSGEPAENLSEEPSTTPAREFKLRKMTTVKGRFQPTKVEASIVKNKNARKASREASLSEPEKLLAKVREAFNESKDYEGVVVMPMVPATPIQESSLPWCVNRERTNSGMDRYLEFAPFGWSW